MRSNKKPVNVTSKYNSSFALFFKKHFHNLLLLHVYKLPQKLEYNFEYMNVIIKLNDNVTVYSTNNCKQRSKTARSTKKNKNALTRCLDLLQQRLKVFNKLSPLLPCTGNSSTQLHDILIYHDKWLLKGAILVWAYFLLERKLWFSDLSKAEHNESPP